MCSCFSPFRLFLANGLILLIALLSILAVFVLTLNLFGIPLLMKCPNIYGFLDRWNWYSGASKRSENSHNSVQQK